MLRRVGKQSSECVESVSEEEKEGCSEKDLQKRKVLSPEWKSEWIVDDESGESTELVEIEITLKLAVTSCCMCVHVCIYVWH